MLIDFLDIVSPIIKDYYFHIIGVLVAILVISVFTKCFSKPKTRKRRVIKKKSSIRNIKKILDKTSDNERVRREFERSRNELLNEKTVVNNNPNLLPKSLSAELNSPLSSPIVTPITPEGEDSAKVEFKRPSSPARKLSIGNDPLKTPIFPRSPGFFEGSETETESESELNNSGLGFESDN